MHDAEAAREIVEVLIGELREAQATAAVNVVLRVMLPDSVIAENVGFAASDVRGNEITVNLGTLQDGFPRRAVIRLKLPAGNPGDDLRFEAVAEGRASSQHGSAVFQSYSGSRR
jgi:hypothetical protein